MTITLDAHTQGFVDQQVQTGVYDSPESCLADAVDQLKFMNS